MGTLNIAGSLNIHNYLSATNTNLYLSSASADYSIRLRAGTTEFLRAQLSSSTTGTAAGTITGLYLFGPTYGNDATNTKIANQLSIGDPGPQIIFNTQASLSGGQPCALIYTDHNNVFSGNSLSLVSSESNCAFIAPTIKALTKFIGALDGNASTATTLSATLAVNKGGTGRATLTSGYVLIGNGTSAVSLRALTNNTAVGASGWNSTTGPYLITHNTLAYWNGAYSGTSSNLAYCSKGAFGSIVTKNTGDYLLSSGGTLTGGLTINYAHTGGGMLHLKSTSNNESSIDYAAGTTTYWVVGKGCGGTGNATFAWWYDPNGSNSMTLTSAGVLTTTRYYATSHISIGTNLTRQNSNRAELHIVSAGDNPTDLWMGVNSTPTWSLSIRGTADGTPLSVYNVSGGHVLRIYTNGMIKLNQGNKQYGSSLPTGLGSGDKGCIFFKT